MGILLGNFLPEKSPKNAVSLLTSCQQMTQLLRQENQLQAPSNIQVKTKLAIHRNFDALGKSVLRFHLGPKVSSPTRAVNFTRLSNLGPSPHVKGPENLQS